MTSAQPDSLHGTRLLAVGCRDEEGLPVEGRVPKSGGQPGGPGNVSSACHTSEGEEVNFTVCAQGLRRRAPGRLTRHNYGNRDKKAGATLSAETVCQGGGHMARASCPHEPRRPRTAAPNASSPTGASRARCVERASLPLSLNPKARPSQPTARALSSHALAGWFQHAAPGLGRPSRTTWSQNGRPHKPPSRGGTTSELVSGAGGP